MDGATRVVIHTCTFGPKPMGRAFCCSAVRLKRQVSVIASFSCRDVSLYFILLTHSNSFLRVVRSIAPWLISRGRVRDIMVHLSGMCGVSVLFSEYNGNVYKGDTKAISAASMPFQCCSSDYNSNAHDRDAIDISVAFMVVSV